jgi:hypothetical protein
VGARAGRSCYVKRGQPLSHPCGTLPRFNGPGARLPISAAAGGNGAIGQMKCGEGDFFVLLPIAACPQYAN